MRKIRVIARIDVKNEHAIKGIHLEGLRKVGDPNILAKKYYDAGIDEIVFMDAVAAYYDRNNLSNIIEKACKNIFVPITVGGGIRSIEDIQKALNAGADKIAINTQAVRTPEFISKAAKVFGSQCIVASVEAKKISTRKWEAYVDNGRESTGIDVVEWVKKLEGMGAGEIMLTSVDKEGTKKGFDLELNSSVSEGLTIPLISCGGAGSPDDVMKLVSSAQTDAVALASILHYNLVKVGDVKSCLKNKSLKVRL